MTEKDKWRLEEILKYISDVESFKKRFGNSLEDVKSDKAYLNCLCMSVSEIGEMTKYLSKDLKKNYATDVQWNALLEARNFLVHEYFRINEVLLWETVTEELPKLKVVCEQSLETEKEKCIETSEEKKEAEQHETQEEQKNPADDDLDP